MTNPDLNESSARIGGWQRGVFRGGQTGIRLRRTGRAAAGAAGAGLPILDLTASNPTRCGFEYDAGAILGALQFAAALDYDPNPKGLLRAREAVAGYYAGHGAAVEPEHIFLTTSTSEAYSYLFRLLCDPGDEVLIAQPSYPLFDFLADLDDVRLVAYPLFYDHGWQSGSGGIAGADYVADAGDCAGASE